MKVLLNSDSIDTAVHNFTEIKNRNVINGQFAQLYLQWFLKLRRSSVNSWQHSNLTIVCVTQSRIYTVMDLCLQTAKLRLSGKKLPWALLTEQMGHIQENDNQSDDKLQSWVSYIPVF